jgi:hypothetical protein
MAICGINPPFGGLSPTSGQVAHVLRTLAPLNSKNIATLEAPCDLHVLSTPPAFVLSQNQTLRVNRCDSTLPIDSRGTRGELRAKFVHGLAIRPRKI